MTTVKYYEVWSKDQVKAASKYLRQKTLSSPTTKQLQEYFETGEIKIVAFDEKDQFKLTPAEYKTMISNSYQNHKIKKLLDMPEEELLKNLTNGTVVLPKNSEWESWELLKKEYEKLK